MSDRANTLAALREKFERWSVSWETCEPSDSPWPNDPDGGELRLVFALRDVLDELTPEGLRRVAAALDVE